MNATADAIADADAAAATPRMIHATSQDGPDLPFIEPVAGDPASWLATVWRALEAYREDLIPEGDPMHDATWADLCEAMAWIEEDLGTDLEPPSLRHFGTPEDVVEYALQEQRENLREDLASMIGSEAEHYTDEEVATVEDMMADLKAVLAVSDAEEQHQRSD